MTNKRGYIKSGKYAPTSREVGQLKRFFKDLGEKKDEGEI